LDRLQATNTGRKVASRVLGDAHVREGKAAPPRRLAIHQSVYGYEPTRETDLSLSKMDTFLPFFPKDGGGICPFWGLQNR
jgi:hypothetical protein